MERHLVGADKHNVFSCSFKTTGTVPPDWLNPQSATTRLKDWKTSRASRTTAKESLE